MVSKWEEFAQKPPVLHIQNFVQGTKIYKEVQVWHNRVGQVGHGTHNLSSGTNIKLSLLLRVSTVWNNSCCHLNVHKLCILPGCWIHHVPMKSWMQFLLHSTLPWQLCICILLPNMLNSCHMTFVPGVANHCSYHNEISILFLSHHLQVETCKCYDKKGGVTHPLTVWQNFSRRTPGIKQPKKENMEFPDRRFGKAKPADWENRAGDSPSL